MAQSTHETQLELHNYTQLLEERALLKGRLESVGYYLSHDERSKAAHRFKAITQFLNKSYIKTRGL